MAITPEYVLSLAQRIQDTKASLAALEAEWNDVFSPITTAPSVTEPTPIRTREKRADSMPSMVVDLLTSTGESLDAAEIAHRVGKPLASIRKVLQKLFTESKIERAERGRYRALPVGSGEEMSQAA